VWGICLLLAGFKSRTRFISVRDISQTCMYESEIVDNGPQSSPLFKVHVRVPPLY